MRFDLFQCIVYYEYRTPTAIGRDGRLMSISNIQFRPATRALEREKDDKHYYTTKLSTDFGWCMVWWQRDQSKTQRLAPATYCDTQWKCRVGAPHFTILSRYYSSHHRHHRHHLRPTSNLTMGWIGSSVSLMEDLFKRESWWWCLNHLLLSACRKESNDKYIIYGW